MLAMLLTSMHHLQSPEIFCVEKPFGLNDATILALIKTDLRSNPTQNHGPPYFTRGFISHYKKSACYIKEPGDYVLSRVSLPIRLLTRTRTREKFYATMRKSPTRYSTSYE
jgi:hypothetical protein